MAYDEKFRKKAVEYKGGGKTFAELKEVFGITNRSYYEWKQNKEQSGFYVLPKKERATRKRKGETRMQNLYARLSTEQMWI